MAIAISWSLLPDFLLDRNLCFGCSPSCLSLLRPAPGMLFFMACLRQQRWATRHNFCAKQFAFYVRCYTNQRLHTLALRNPAFAQTSSHTISTPTTPCAHTSFYTRFLLHQLSFTKPSFTPTNFHTNCLLHKLAVAQTSFLHHLFLHILVFKQSSSYTTRFSHKISVTPTCFCAN